MRTPVAAAECITVRCRTSDSGDGKTSRSTSHVLGSAAAPAARCRNCLRWGSFIATSHFHALLFDHLVDAREQRLRNVEIKRPSNLEVDHQLELGRRLHWQIRSFLALEDAIDVA